MKLTGECNKEFEKWYHDKYSDNQPWELIKSNKFFNTLPDSMKWGVLVDYFDSVGIHIELGFDGEVYHYQLSKGIEFLSLVELKTRHEARTKAIEQADTLRNEQLKN